MVTTPLNQHCQYHGYRTDPDNFQRVEQVMQQPHPQPLDRPWSEGDSHGVGEAQRSRGCDAASCDVEGSDTRNRPRPLRYR
jgi:hypothetical protein